MPARALLVLLAATAAAVAVAATVAAAAFVTPALAARGGSDEPALEARALLPADASAPAPFAGAPNTEPIDAAGARQPVGGFSALLDAPGRDAFWAMPDNGFGSKANSRSFLLRVYRVRADVRTVRGGDGDVEILDWITLRDPDGKVPFDIVREGTPDRLLTGGDFDIESMRVDRDGDLWFGEEFGPFLLHTDATGRVLEAPIELPGVRSPDHPGGGTPNLGRSNGFEGMAISQDGRTLYPTLEGAVTGDDPRVRRMYEFDIPSRRYAPQHRTYRVADPSYLVSDLTLLQGRRFVALERDNFQGTAARHKRAFVIDLRVTDPDGALAKREVADLLDIADPDRISLHGARRGDIGLGDPFSMPYVTIESVLPVGGERLAIVNDTNFGSRGRNPNLDDDSDFVVIRAAHLHAPPRPPRLTLAVIGDTPYGDDPQAAFPRLVADVNAEPAVDVVLHLGDIKNGSSTCDDERFARLKALYDAFADPFVYTPGDNEWTDCHRAAAGGYLPVERLAALRRIFYPRPGFTAGASPMHVRTQADDRGFEDFVENRMWRDASVVFSTVHVVGSNNDLAPWFGAAETPEQRALRLAEFEKRLEADLAWIDRTFERAGRGHSTAAVVLAMQADTFTFGTPEGFTAIVERIAERAREFAGPVLLLQGDTHEFRVDRPLPTAPNLQRIVVEGETASEWLRLDVDRRAPGVFSHVREQVP